MKNVTKLDNILIRFLTLDVMIKASSEGLSILYILASILKVIGDLAVGEWLSCMNIIYPDALICVQGNGRR